MWKGCDYLDLHHRNVATQWNISATLFAFLNYAHNITSKTNQNEFVQIESVFLIDMHIFVMFQIVTVLWNTIRDLVPDQRFYFQGTHISLDTYSQINVFSSIIRHPHIVARLVGWMLLRIKIVLGINVVFKCTWCIIRLLPEKSRFYNISSST